VYGTSELLDKKHKQSSFSHPMKKVYGKFEIPVAPSRGVSFVEPILRGLTIGVVVGVTLAIFILNR
jgi:hypothetical protein